MKKIAAVSALSALSLPVMAADWSAITVDFSGETTQFMVIAGAVFAVMVTIKGFSMLKRALS